MAVDDDRDGNLHAPLVARDLNPRVRLRLRMFNEELAERTQQLLDDCTCHDAAALAAPAFVSVVLHEDWHQRVAVAGQELVVRGGSAGEPGALLPRARIREDGAAELLPTEGGGLLCLAQAAPAADITRTRHGVAPRRSGAGGGRLYFTVTILTTAGFGDPHAKGLRRCCRDGASVSTGGTRLPRERGSQIAPPLT